MIEQGPFPPARALLFEGLLSRRLLELRGLQFIFDADLHGTRGTTLEPEPAAEPRPEPSETSQPPEPELEPSAAQPSAPQPIESEAIESEAIEPEPESGSRPEHDDGPLTDERFPALSRFRGLLEAGAGHLAVARAAHVEHCRQAGVQMRALAAFAAQRPSSVLDRPEDEVGSAAAASRAARPAALTAVSEWAVDDVMVALGLSSRAAGSVLADAVTLAERLPATLDVLEEGRISLGHARALAEIVGPVKDEARAGVEARLLARVEGKTVAQLREAARRAVLRADAAAAARRLARAIRERSVRLQPGADGMAELAAVMTLPVARACLRALEAYAGDCRTPGDGRTKEQRMADCLVDLILRPGINPPVQIGLTLVAGVNTLAGGDQPGEVDGHPVSAAEVRELAYALGLLPRPQPPAPDTTLCTPAPDTEPAPPAEVEAEAEPEAELEREPEAEVEAEPEAEPEADGEAEPASKLEPEGAAGTQLAGAHADEAELGPAAASGRPLSTNQAAAAQIGRLLALRSTAGTALAHLPQIAIFEEISGQLLALTDATQIRHAATCGHRKCRTGKRPCTHPPAGPGLGPPRTTPGYSPSDPLARFVRARDRRCRFPGCRAPAIRCDLDHNQPWPSGRTSADNLCCLCRHHHRLSHQAPGWTMTRLPDGGLQWTTPGGDTITTHPIPYGTDDLAQPPPEEAVPVTKPIGILEQLRRWPPSPADPDEEPAPF